MTLHFLAHAGEEHATKSSSISHFIKGDGVKILIILLVTVGALYIALKVLNKSPSDNKKTNSSD